MAKSSRDKRLVDPYRNFKFRVDVGGRAAAGFATVSGLERDSDAAKYREGGNSSTAHTAPGRARFAALMLECGITRDPEFEKWARDGRKFGASVGSKNAPADFRKDIVIEMYGEAGRITARFKVFRCWVSEFQSQPGLDANVNAVAIQKLRLESEGWERDSDAKEPPANV